MAFLHINTHTTHNSSIRSDEGLTLENSALKLFTMAKLPCFRLGDFKLQFILNKLQKNLVQKKKQKKTHSLAVYRPGPHLFHAAGVQNQKQMGIVFTLNRQDFHIPLNSARLRRHQMHLQQKSLSRSHRYSENQHKIVHQKHFVSRHFCNLNRLSQRFKFWVKFPSKNRCHV